MVDEERRRVGDCSEGNYRLERFVELMTRESVSACGCARMNACSPIMHI